MFECGVWTIERVKIGYHTITPDTAWAAPHSRDIINHCYLAWLSRIHHIALSGHLVRVCTSDGSGMHKPWPFHYEYKTAVVSICFFFRNCVHGKCDSASIKDQVQMMCCISPSLFTLLWSERVPYAAPGQAGCPQNNLIIPSERIVPGILSGPAQLKCPLCRKDNTESWNVARQKASPRSGVFDEGVGFPLSS